MWWLCYEREGRTVAVVIVEASSLVHAQMHAAIAALGGGGRFTVGHQLDAHCVAQLAPEDLRRNLSPAEADALLEEGSFVLNYNKYEPDEVARARADEIVAALNAESAATRAGERKFGLRAAERKRDRAADRACSLAEEIVDVHAHTAAGIMGKERCVAAQCNGEIVIDGTGIGADLALSIAADLIEMGKAVA